MIEIQIEKIRDLMADHSDEMLFSYLFGSRASGTSSEKSDVDIAVYLRSSDNEACFDIKINLYLHLSRLLKTDEIDLVVMNRCRNLVLLNRIVTHGIVIYDGNPALRRQYEQKIMHRAIDFLHQRKQVMGV